MKFKFYDILAQLIPGFLVYIAYLLLTDKSFDKDFIIPATAIAFVIGYFVNTVASWAEDLYYWTWGGKPSDQLLEGKNIWKVKFYDHQETKRLLIDEASSSRPKNDELFGIAMRYVTPEVNGRVNDFNANYAFSRVMLTTTLIASGMLIWEYYDQWFTYAALVPLIFVAWYRCKQRGYYFAREVLKTYLKIKKDEERAKESSGSS